MRTSTSLSVQSSGSENAVWTPLQLSPVVYLRADNASASLITDQGSAGYDVSQAFAPDRPSISASVAELGGMPAVSYVGEQVLFREASMPLLPTGSDPRTLLMVYVNRSNAFKFRCGWQGVGSAGGQACGGGGNGHNAYFESTYAPFGTVEVVGTAYYTCDTYDGTTSRTRRNGADGTATAAAPGGGGTGAQLAIGALDTDKNFSATFDLAEWILLDYVIGTTARAAWEAYVQARYSL